VDAEDLPWNGELMEANPAWDAWRPEVVNELLADVDARWYVVAGWALDLFRGEQTRDHEDIEIGVPTADFSQLREALARYDCEVVGSNDDEPARRWPLQSPAFDEHFQTWIREPLTGVYRMDIFRDSHRGDTWLCRRDASIRLPYGDVIMTTSTGIPFMAPEIVLLFKAKHNREKDRADFDGIRPSLTDLQVNWLHASLRRVHPDHPWLGLL
jgi:hypothetical protein